MSIEESPTARERRAWVERQERFKDLQEEYERRSAAASSPEERRQLAQVFSEQRRAHREEDVRLGKRSPGLAVQMHQIMWARWIEVAVEHELEARRGYRDIAAKPESDAIIREFHASLVAVTAAAHTIEAVFGDIKYLIPPQPRRDKRHQELRHGFRVAFGISGATDEQLSEEFRWLFALRDSAAHPYTESEPPARHPAGINTGVEHSRFNAITCGRAIDVAMAVLELVASPRGHPVVGSSDGQLKGRRIRSESSSFARSETASPFPTPSPQAARTDYHGGIAIAPSVRHLQLQTAPSPHIAKETKTYSGRWSRLGITRAKMRSVAGSTSRSRSSRRASALLPRRQPRDRISRRYVATPPPLPAPGERT